MRHVIEQTNIHVMFFVMVHSPSFRCYSYIINVQTNKNVLIHKLISYNKSYVVAVRSIEYV